MFFLPISLLSFVTFLCNDLASLFKGHPEKLIGHWLDMVGTIRKLTAVRFKMFTLIQKILKEGSKLILKSTRAAIFEKNGLF